MFIIAVTEDNTQAKFRIEFDKYGNLYFIHENNVFQINVGEQNELVADLNSYDIINAEKVDLINAIKKHQDDHNENDIYYPEDEDAYVEAMSENSSELENSEEQREFLFISKSSESEIPINNRKFGDYQALYDTFIYDNHEELCFRTKERYNEILYRVKIVLPHKISIRTISGDDVEYKLRYNTETNVLDFF